jgi:NTE family protein
LKPGAAAASGLVVGTEGGWLVDERVILVLGGGGMKGLAHVGAWRALVEAGVEVSEVVGTSIGALVGACISGGMDADRLTLLARELKRTDVVTLNRWAILFNGIRQPSVFRDTTFRRHIESVLPANRLWQAACAALGECG